MSVVLNKSLKDYIILSQQGLFLNKDTLAKSSVGILERLLRAIGSKLNLCETTEQKSFGLSIRLIKKELKSLDANSKPAEQFIRLFRRDLDSEIVRETLNTLAPSPKAKKDLRKIAKLTTSIARKHFKEERLVECNDHYKGVSVEGNRNLKLSAFPRKCEKSTPITQGQKDAYLAGFETETNENVKKVAEKAINSIQHFTQAQLDAGLEECATILNERLRELGMPSYAVAVSEKKSSQWCMELATPYLDYAPTSGLSIGGGGVIIGVGQSIARPGDVTNIKEDVLVLFEDCSYSGHQLNSYIRDFMKNRSDANLPIKLFVIVPFMSEKALSLNNGNIKYRLEEEGIKNVTVEIITTATRIKAVNDVFIPDTEERKIFQDLAFNTTPENCFAICDWRFPDSTSFPEHFAKAELAPQRNVVAPYKV